jgi:hypothetical protein
MYRSDVRGAMLFVAVLWVTVLFVLFMVWPYISNGGIKTIIALAAAAVLIFNTAAIVAMLRNYASDKDFIYRLDIENLDAARQRKP